MLLGLATAMLVLGALLWELTRPKLLRMFAAVRGRAHERARERRQTAEIMRARELDYDPGRERRAEQRAQQLLRSCVDQYDWQMYRDLGFVRVRAGDDEAYLIYPHRPIVAYAPQTGRLLGEHCVDFCDRSHPAEAGRHALLARIPVSAGAMRLPDADDVLAKWMALRADEARLMARANMHLPGRQLDRRRVERDLRRLAVWEREREGVVALDNVPSA